MTNILLLTADDMDGNTPGSFGGPADATPWLDRLAAEGQTFGRGHVPAAVCQPSRSAILSGLWPHRNGAEGFEPINDGIGVFTDLLKAAGYLVGILGKVEHLQPVDRFGWDLAITMTDLGMGRDPETYGRNARNLFDRAARDQRPWFLMANAHDPHRPFHGSEAEQEFWTEEQRASYPAATRIFHADEVEVPGFLPDLPGVRTEYAEYLSSSRRCDDVVGAVLGALDDAGATEDTLVVFLSDNGMAFPFAKANCYLRSTLTPLIIRWPGVTTPASTDATSFVNALDLFPTFCDAAGLPTPADLDGRSLRPLFDHDTDQGRERVFTVFHETSAKQRFEMRCVQDSHYGYIWNQWADGKLHYRAENMWGLSWPAMVAAAEANAEVRQRVEFYLTRTPEELYDLQADPDCLHNLAGKPNHAVALAERQAALAAWMASTRDPLRERYNTYLRQPSAASAAR